MSKFYTNYCKMMCNNTNIPADTNAAKEFMDAFICLYISILIVLINPRTTYGAFELDKTTKLIKG